MADGNLVRQSNVGKDSVVFGPSVYDVPLLPYEKQLIATIGITEEEYRKFAEEVRRRGRLRPAEYEHIPDIKATGTEAVLISLAISLVLTGVSYLLTPKPKMPGAQKQGGSVDTEGITGASRFTPSRGFETLAQIADYGSPIPIIFGLYDNSEKVGGMLVTPRLVWSRMFSDGTQQRAKLLFVVGEQGLFNPDVAGGLRVPDQKGIFLGNNALDQSYNNLFAFYWRPSTDREVNDIGVKSGVIGKDLAYGTKGKADFGDPDGPKGDDDPVFVCPTTEGERQQAFCHAFSPVNNTQFGAYYPIANGNSYRVNYQVHTIFYKEGDERNPGAKSRRKQALERVKVLGDQNFTRDRNGGFGSGDLLEALSNGQLKVGGDEFVGRNYSPRMGVYKVRKGETVIFIDDDKLKKDVEIEVGDEAVFLISNTSIPEDLYSSGGVSVEDINTSIKSLQLAADDAMQIGELFSIGGVLFKVFKRSKDRFEPDVPEAERVNQEITLKCIDTSLSVNNTIGIVNEELVIRPGDSRKYYIDDLENIGENFYPITKVSVATVRNNRPSACTEFGIKSNVFQQLKGICAFSGLPAPADIAEYGENFISVNTGVATASIVRSSVFRIFIRDAGDTDSDFADVGLLFCIRGSKPVAQYNSLRITKPTSSSLKFVQFEFKFAAVPGSDLRALPADQELVELNQTFDNDSLQTRSVNVPGIGRLDLTYRGKTVRKSSIAANKEFFRAASITGGGSTGLIKPDTVVRHEVAPKGRTGTRITGEIGDYDKLGPSGAVGGLMGAFGHAIAGRADSSSVPVNGYTNPIRQREWNGSRFVVIDYVFKKIKLNSDHYSGESTAWLIDENETRIIGSSDGWNSGDRVKIRRGADATFRYGGKDADYPESNPFKRGNTGGVVITYSGIEIRIKSWQVKKMDPVGDRGQEYYYQLFGDAEGRSLGSTKTNTRVKTLGDKGIVLKLTSEVIRLRGEDGKKENHFSGKTKGWSRPTIEVIRTDVRTTGNWEVDELVTDKVNPEVGENPFENGYGELRFVYRIASISEVTDEELEGGTGPGINGEQEFITTSQLSDISLYRNFVEKSNEREPEHSLVYVNETQGDTGVASYNNLTLAGLSLRASRNFTQLDQLRVWLGEGLQVERLLPPGDYPTGNQREIGPSNLFADLVFYLLTDQTAGAGGLLGMTSNDAPLVDKDQMIEAARFMQKERLYFNGAITERSNVRQFIADLAPNFLCNFIVSDGKFSLKPAIPYHASSGNINTGPVEIEQLFTAGNILEDTFKVEYLSSEERRPFAAVVRFRQERENRFPEEKSIQVTLNGSEGEDSSIEYLPQEQFDLTAFCTSEEHAVMVAKYFLSLRKLVTHTISFSTTLEGLNISAGSYIKVFTEASPYSPANNGTISSTGLVTSAKDLPDGQYEISYYKSSDNVDVSGGVMNVINGRVEESTFYDSVFSITSDSVSSNVYVVEQLTFSEEGTVDIVASEHPCDDNDRSELASLITSNRFGVS